jgi:hypothetical protein
MSLDLVVWVSYVVYDVCFMCCVSYEGSVCACVCACVCVCVCVCVFVVFAAFLNKQIIFLTLWLSKTSIQCSNEQE